jgi:hypothetical protein
MIATNLKSKTIYYKQNSYLKRDSITAIPIDRVTHIHLLTT